MKTKKFYPFSEKLIKDLKRVRQYSKAVKAYDRLPNNGRTKELRKTFDDIDSCFIFSDTKEGMDYWYGVIAKIKSK